MTRYRVSSYTGVKAKAMRVGVVTLFPEMFEALRLGVTGRALTQGWVELRCWNPRDFSDRPGGYVDDSPYGGGPGMVMQAPPVLAATRAAMAWAGPQARVSLMAPHGRVWQHQTASCWVDEAPHRVLICGRYEGVDQRVEDLVVDDVISVGDYVLSGGELAAMVVLDSAWRWVDGVVGDAQSVREDSFEGGRLDFPHYTRPEKVENLVVPDILLSGHHEQIAQWRHEQALARTRRCRPDLIEPQ